MASKLQLFALLIQRGRLCLSSVSLSLPLPACRRDNCVGVACGSARCQPRRLPAGAARGRGRVHLPLIICARQGQKHNKLRQNALRCYGGGVGGAGEAEGARRRHAGAAHLKIFYSWMRPPPSLPARPRPIKIAHNLKSRRDADADVDAGDEDILTKKKIAEAQTRNGKARQSWLHCHIPCSCVKGKESLEAHFYQVYRGYLL